GLDGRGVGRPPPPVPPPFLGGERAPHPRESSRHFACPRVRPPPPPPAPPPLRPVDQGRCVYFSYLLETRLEGAVLAVFPSPRARCGLHWALPHRGNTEVWPRKSRRGMSDRPR